MMLAAGGLAICCVLVVLIRGFGPTTVNLTVTASPGKGKNVISPPKEPETAETGPAKPSTQTPKDTQSPSLTMEERITAKIKDAVFLLQVEKAGRFWSIGSCSAIGKNTLLTGAREAALLQKERKEPGLEWKIWITNPESGLKLAVQDIYVNTVYLSPG